MTGRSQHAGHSRVLLHDEGTHATAGSKPRPVDTVQQLLSAVTAGASHIEIRQHMDLSALPLQHSHRTQDHQQAHSILGALPATVQTVRGNCSGTTPTTEALLHAAAELQPPLPPLAPGQCLILTDANAIAAWHTLWLDSLLLRHVPSRRSPGAAWLLGGGAPPAATAPGPAAALYLTRTTLQGSVAVPADQEGGAGGRRDTGAAGQARPSLSQELHRDGSGSVGVVVRDSLFAGGCTFANFGGGQAAAVLATHPAASASFTNCTFQSNTFPPAPPANTLPGAPTAVEVPTTAVPPAAIRVTTNLAAVRLEQCLFRGNAQAGGHGNGTAAEDCADVAVADGVRVYADTQSSATWRARDGGGWQVGGMWIDGVNTQSLSAADTGDFLSAGDEWLQVQPEVDWAAHFTVAPPEGGTAGAPAASLQNEARAQPRAAMEIGGGAIALFTVFSFAAVMCASLMIFWCWWRLNRAPPLTAEFPAAPVTPVKPPLKLHQSHTAVVRTAGNTSPVFSPAHPSGEPARPGRIQKFSTFPQPHIAARPALTHSNPFYDAAMRSPDSSPTAADSRASSSAVSAALLHASRTDAAAALPPPPPRLPVSLLRLQLGAAEALRQRRPPPLPRADTVAAGSWEEMPDSEATAAAAVRLPPLAPVPPPGAPAWQRLEFVHQQLDSIAGWEVLEGLVLQPQRCRRLQGGQAIIQFATDRKTGQLWAVKFFLSARGFEDEATLYRDPGCPLGPFLPLVRNVIGGSSGSSGGGNGGQSSPAAAAEAGRGALEGRIVDVFGRPLPPCIVMEHGESLDMWRTRNAADGIDVFTALQIVNHIAETLAAVHDVGYVHRDLKPSNVMWLPRRNRWTLIDFGCAARAGAAAPLSFSPAYAAPEVVRAHRAGHDSLAADPKADAWSLGIVAIEVFCNQMPLDLMEGEDMVMRRIVGELPLPWEDVQTGAPIARALGRYRGTIMSLLHRDPARRPTVAEFLRTSRDIVSRVSTPVPAGVIALSAADHAARAAPPSSPPRIALRMELGHGTVSGAI